MTLRKKTLFIISVTVITLILFVYATSRIIVLDSFVSLEEQYTHQHAERALSVLLAELAKLGSTASDWALWDDTYAFIEGTYDDYVRDNLMDSTFANLRLNLMVFINFSGQIIFGKAFDLQNEKEIPIPESLQKHLSDNDLLLRHVDAESSTIGIVLLHEGPLLIASRPILTSEGEGPIRGTLIMGRYLDSAEIERLAEIIHLSLTVHRFNDLQMPADFQQARSFLSTEVPIFVRPLSTEFIAGYALLEDIYGKPGLVMRVDIPREIYKQGRMSVRYFVLSLLGISLAFGGGILVLLEKVVLSRLTQLSASASRISINRDLSTRMSVTGEDELSDLADAINRMLATLEQSQRDLQESEGRYRSLVETSPDAIMLTDLSGHCIMANQRTVELLGLENIEELVGQDAFGCIVAEDRQRAMENAHKALETGSVRDIECSMFRQDGTLFFAELSISVVTDAEDKPTAFIEVVRDVTRRKQVEEAIVRAKEEWERTFDAVPDLIAILNNQYKIVHVNKAMADKLGFTPQEAVGLTCYEVIHGMDSPPPFCPHAQLLLDGKEHTEEVHEDRLGGDFLVTTSPVYDPEGQLVGSVHVARDITERKQAEEALRESEKRYRTLVENLPIGIYRTTPGPKGKFLMANPAFLSMFGFNSEEELKHMSVSALYMNPDERKVFSDDLLIRGSVTGSEFWLKAKDGPAIWGSVTARVVYGESREIAYFDCSIADITERKQAEEKLRQYHDQLEELVEERTAALQEEIARRKQAEEELRELNQQLQVANTSKDKFFSIIAHDLRSPFTGLIGLTEAIVETIEFYSKDQIKDKLSRLHTSAQKVYALLTNLLAWSRLQQGLMVPEPENISLTNIGERNVHLFASDAEQKQITLRSLIPKGTMAYADHKMIDTVMRNLLSNALKFTNAGGTIEVSILHQNEGFVEIAVSDTGIGMSQEDINTLFRIDVKSTRPGTAGEEGTGLGLILCKELVEKNAGAIRVESEAGKGTAFVFILPQMPGENK